MKNQRPNVAITRNKIIRRKRIFLFLRILFVVFLFGLLVGYLIGKNNSIHNLYNNNDEITQSHYSESQKSTDSDAEESQEN